MVMGGSLCLQIFPVYWNNVKKPSPSAPSTAVDTPGCLREITLWRLCQSALFLKKRKEKKKSTSVAHVWQTVLLHLAWQIFSVCLDQLEGLNVAVLLCKLGVSVRQLVMLWLIEKVA